MQKANPSPKQCYLHQHEIQFPGQKNKFHDGMSYYMIRKRMHWIMIQSWMGGHVW